MKKHHFPKEFKGFCFCQQGKLIITCRLEDTTLPPYGDDIYLRFANIKDTEDLLRFLKNNGPLHTGKKVILLREAEEEVQIMKNILECTSAYNHRAYNKSAQISDRLRPFIDNDRLPIEPNFDAFSWLPPGERKASLYTELVLSAIMNQKLEKVKIAMTFCREGIFAGHRTDLLGAMYYDIRLAISSNRDHMVCANESCGNYFVPKDPRQVYCEHTCACTQNKRETRRNAKKEA